MGFQRSYKCGDIVEIVTPQEYRGRGGSCTDKCAIARFCGSICEVVRDNVYGYTLSPIKVVENFPPEHEVDKNISTFSWKPMSLKIHDYAIDESFDLAFDTVFQ